VTTRHGIKDFGEVGSIRYIIVKMVKLLKKRSRDDRKGKETLL
jgi:hypothetical protein